MPKPGPKPKVDRPEPDYWNEERLTNAEEDIEDFLDEWSPGTSVVEIYEMKRDGSRPHMERVDINILKADLFGYLREHFGAGKYLLQFKDSQRRIRKSLVVDVGGPKGTTVDRPQSSFMEQMLLTMIAAQKPIPPPPPIDMGTLLTGLGTMLAAMKPSPPPAGADPAAMLQAMAATFQQLRPADDNVEKALSIISKAKDIAGNGGGNTEDSWPGLLKEGITTVAGIFTNRNNGNPPAPARPAIPPGAQPVTLPTVAAPAHMEPATEKTADMILQEWLQAQLGFLKMKARAGKEPEDWVDYVLDNQEEPGAAAILEALRRGATFQHLLTFDPEIGKDPVLANWFQRFYEDLQTELKKAMDTGGPGGDASNPGGNEKSSTE
jgi:hypothetical protein